MYFTYSYTFIIKTRWILSNDSSVSMKEIMYFLPLSQFIWCTLLIDLYYWFSLVTQRRNQLDHVVCSSQCFLTWFASFRLRIFTWHKSSGFGVCFSMFWSCFVWYLLTLLPFLYFEIYLLLSLCVRIMFLIFWHYRSSQIIAWVLLLLRRNTLVKFLKSVVFS